MKNVFLLITTIILLIMVSYSEINLINSTTDLLLEYNDLIKESLDDEDMEKAKQNLLKTYNEWDKKKDNLNIFIERIDIDKISDAILELQLKIESDNIIEAKEKNKILKELIINTKENSKLTIINIL